MATFTVEIPDEHAARLIAALCGLHDFAGQAEKDEQPARFANRMVRDYLTSQVARWEASEAANAARIAVEQNKIIVTDPNAE